MTKSLKLDKQAPRDVADGAYLIAVTRVETSKVTEQRASLDTELAGKVADLIAATRDLPNVRGVQLDFDAVVSERDFYRQLMTALRTTLDEGAARNVRVPLTMTALASWCVGDAWFNDFPVDEAVRGFQMTGGKRKDQAFLETQRLADERSARAEIRHWREDGGERGRH